MGEPWYVSAFGAFYQDLYHRRDTGDARRAVEFLRREGLVPGPEGRVLDLCCGAGRHAVLLAGEDRVQVTGLDLAGNLLREAQRAAARCGLGIGQGPCLSARTPESGGHGTGKMPVRLCGSQGEVAGGGVAFVRGDMRHLPFRAGSFALTVNLFTSFGYFEDEADDQAVVAEIARVLGKGDGRLPGERGGRAVLDLIHPAWLRAHLVPESRRTTPAGREVQEWRRYDGARRRVEKRMEIVSPDGTVRRLMESVRCYEAEELAALARRAGLHVERKFGDFDSRPLTGETPRAIYVLVREK